jgi:regulator of sirC expression with transglutaminase-like and TPR domain
MSDDKPLRVYADCTQAINFAPDNFEAYLNRGVALYTQGDYPAAIVDHNSIRLG